MTVQEIRAANTAEIVDSLYQRLEYHQAQLKKHQERAAELMTWIRRINKQEIENESRNQ